MRVKHILTAIAAFACLGCLLIAVPDAHAQDGKTNTMGKMKMEHAPLESRYGGPVYTGKPALTVTASLVEAGGGPADYSTARALTSMVGAELVGKEVARLNGQYGEDRVKQWLTVFDFAVKDALAVATKAGVKLPKGNLAGKKLASTLVTAGLDKDGTFYVEYLLDHALTHDIHCQVMDDIDSKFGADADSEYHRITNQAMYDLAQALGAKKVKLAQFH